MNFVCVLSFIVVKWIKFMCATKVGVVELLNGLGEGVETHAAKLKEVVGGDLHKLLETRTLWFKLASSARM